VTTASTRSFSKKRRDATALVTIAVSHWLWRRGARALAPEVGLHALHGLCTPWDGRWRVDLAATLVSDHVESVHVIEVKGTLADLAREDLTAGKWAVDFPRLGLNPWLAHADTIGPGHLTTLPRAWGLLSVSADGRVRETRAPQHVVDTSVHEPDDNVTRAYRALSQVLTAQALPTLFGLRPESALEMLAERGIDRPWRQYDSRRSPAPEAGRALDEESGAKIL
jgi:hypothetical protein